MAEIRDFNRSQYLLKGEKNKKIKRKKRQIARLRTINGQYAGQTQTDKTVHGSGSTRICSNCRAQFLY